VVECFLAKEDVAGSTPVSRSKIALLRYTSSVSIMGYRSSWGCEGPWKPTLRRGTQVVRERSAKPLCVGSIPTRASNSPRILKMQRMPRFSE
jgi:hypothetical protein